MTDFVGEELPFCGELPVLSHLEVLHLEPGDVVVARSQLPIDMQTAAAIRRELHRLFPGHEVSVLDRSLELGVVRPSSAQKSQPPDLRKVSILPRA